MRNVLIPVDGSRQSEIAVQSVIRQARIGQVEKIHLVNVQPPLGGYIGRFVSRSERDAFRRERGQAALAGARHLLDQAALPYTVHVRVGETVEEIVGAAEDLAVEEIVVGADGFGLLGAVQIHSFVNRLIRRAAVPVSVVKDPGAEMNLGRATGSWWLRPTS
jgi:nucleotide-binding universal stress UspA family protein